MAMVLRRLRLLRSNSQRSRANGDSASVQEQPVVVAEAAAASLGSEKKQANGRSYLSGATVATLAMLAALQARRLYEDKQNELAIAQGKEQEFSPDTKAAFLQLLPLRFISRVWGHVTSANLPVWSRPIVYKSWARAFHTDLDEVPMPLEEYPSLREFFARGLKEGSRPIDLRENCLLSPVDGIMVRYGRVQQPGAKVEQVKGFTYSLSALLGSEPHTMHDPSKVESKEEPKKLSRSIFTFWRSQPTIEKPKQPRPPRELFYCVLYLGPGDYHRVHSPSNWCIDNRRHFPGNLFPVNVRAVRTIKDLYVVNERVVLEGDWKEGLMAMALVGATNIGSIELKFEPELKTNRPKSSQSVPDVKQNCGYCISRGDEVATFNMGSTVVMVFEAPGAVDDMFHVLENPYRGFTFSVEGGQRVRMGQAIGHY